MSESGLLQQDQQGSQASHQHVVKGSLQPVQGNQDLPRVEGEHSVLFFLHQNLLGSTQDSIGEIGLLVVRGKVGIRLELKQGMEPSSLDEVGNPGLFSSCGWKQRVST